jgi:hypothetical protein
MEYEVIGRRPWTQPRHTNKNTASIVSCVRATAACPGEVRDGEHGGRAPGPSEALQPHVCDHPVVARHVAALEQPDDLDGHAWVCDEQDREHHTKHLVCVCVGGGRGEQARAAA